MTNWSPKNIKVTVKGERVSLDLHKMNLGVLLEALEYCADYGEMHEGTLDEIYDLKKYIEIALQQPQIKQ